MAPRLPALPAPPLQLLQCQAAGRCIVYRSPEESAAAAATSPAAGAAACCQRCQLRLLSLAAANCRYAEECQTPEGGWGLDDVLRRQSWKLKGERCRAARNCLHVATASVAGCRLLLPPCTRSATSFSNHTVKQFLLLSAGVVNGIDGREWSPSIDPHLSPAEGYARYDAETLDVGKARCKAALQQVRARARRDSVLRAIHSNVLHCAPA